MDNSNKPPSSDQIKQKLVETKEKWAKEGRLLTGQTSDAAKDRLPSGQREVKNWPVLDLGIQPNIPLDNWKLTVDGLVKNPVALDWKQLQDMPMVDLVSDVHCVTAWSRFDNHWQGVSTRELAKLVQPMGDAKFVLCSSYDGYTTNVPLDIFLDQNSLIAIAWEGKPLTREHGGPVRMVIPKLYFWKSAKWIKRLEFIKEDHPGFWETRGYHNHGDPWLEQRYSNS
ncbi:MAG: sulfite oxidase-like oxidoreductase [Alphaproteobacteria bacterium]|nr:sulfite oxidase-like oxidoreductase [Alphaproteobacteria bacterium]